MGVLALARCMQKACKEQLYYEYGYFPNTREIEDFSFNRNEVPYSATFQLDANDPATQGKTYTITIIETLGR